MCSSDLKLTDNAWKQYISKKGNKQTSDSSKIVSKPVSKSQQTPNVLVSDSLVNKHIIFDPNTETKPFKCDEKGCAQWVSNQLVDLGVQRQGNAWHAHNIGQKSRKFTPFTNLKPTIQNEMAKLFSTINANPVEKSLENSVKSLETKLIPDQSLLKNYLKVNDIVGLFFYGSDNFTKAFFEGATGMSDMGKGAKVTDGPYFVKKDGTPWTPQDLGKKIQFLPGKSLKNGSGFGMNTHLGYVGAKVNGEPIIFHNVHGQVFATPLSKMDNTKIFWVKSGPGEAVKPETQNLGYWESIKNFFGF